MAPPGTIIGQIQAAAPTQQQPTTATPPTAIPQVTASPTQIQHLQATQPQAISIPQPQQVTLPPTSVSPQKEVESNTPVSMADSQSLPVSTENLKEEVVDGEYYNFNLQKVLLHFLCDFQVFSNPMAREICIICIVFLQ